ncbi:hypothetical protein DICPUDRAFT_150157 [Dictyostelium purpureum]|uniref:Uncharacterized protein n=1 Tax=Dictyostelium purpureum TaxID=5786 RepID=F0ZFL1_DICPU|nr:uncharacterized protein DICPUDRAFT_150157 [Dictyostelium purpureum]EGC37234.1 hypothetical protein DICPUDRAFT_150157 [Dictyostelium purpureum]|eukprot:XP_003286204.1 hypothetical protein DICPUDRAFT_150157 [Dictyostelium purpureum]
MRKSERISVYVGNVCGLLLIFFELIIAKFDEADYDLMMVMMINHPWVFAEKN